MAEIFVSTNAAYETVPSKPTYADIDKFDEIVNAFMVELIREYDVEEYEMLYLSQDSSKYSELNRSNLSKIGTITVY